MEQIDFYNRTLPQRLSGAKLIIQGLLWTAGEFGGKVYGGFVRDVIVPAENDDSGETTSSWKDVDIWFNDATNAERFVSAMAGRLSYSFARDNDRYPWTVRQYEYIVDGVIISWVDVVVRDTFPVNDFNVNHLAYQFGSGPGTILGVSFTVSVEGECSSSVEELKTSIINKTIIMDEGYSEKCVDSSWRGTALRSRILLRFLNRKWTIVNMDPFLEKVMVQDRRMGRPFYLPYGYIQPE